MIIPLTVNVAASTFTANGRFPFVDGQQVSIDSRIPNQIPAPLVEYDSQETRVFYYLVNASGNSFQVSATAGGTPITLTAPGTGQITLTEYPPLTWEQLVALPLVQIPDIRSRWSTPEAMLNLTAAPDGAVGVTFTGSTFASGIETNYPDWTAIRFTSLGTLPTEIDANTTYYTLNGASDTFQVASVIGGSAITPTGGTGQLTVQNWSLNNSIQEKIDIGGQWLFDALLTLVTNHVDRVNRSWWWWYGAPTELTDIMFYPASLKAQIVLDCLKNPEKLIEAWREFTKWAMVDDGTFRNQIKNPTWFQEFGVPGTGQTLESVAKKRAEQRLAQQAPLLLVTGYQGAHRLFDFGETTGTVNISLI